MRNRFNQGDLPPNLREQVSMTPADTGDDWRDRERRAMDTGDVTGASAETGVAKSRSTKRYHVGPERANSYRDHSFAGGRQLGHSHRAGDVSDDQAAAERDEYVRSSLDHGAPPDLVRRNREARPFHEVVPSAGQDRIPVRGGQTILSPTPGNNVGRLYGMPESSIKQSMRGGPSHNLAPRGRIVDNEGGDDGWRR